MFTFESKAVTTFGAHRGVVPGPCGHQHPRRSAPCKMVGSNHTVGPPHPQMGNSKVSSNTTRVGLRSAHCVVQGPGETRNETDNSQKHSAERPIQEHLLRCSEGHSRTGRRGLRQRKPGALASGVAGVGLERQCPPMGLRGQLHLPKRSTLTPGLHAPVCTCHPQRKRRSIDPVSSAHAEVLREHLLRYSSDGRGVFTFPTQW